MSKRKKPSAVARRAALTLMERSQPEFCKLAGVSKPTLLAFLRCEEIKPSTEAAIFAAIDRAGWRFYGGGVIPKRRA